MSRKPKPDASPYLRRVLGIPLNVRIFPANDLYRLEFAVAIVNFIGKEKPVKKAMADFIKEYAAENNVSTSFCYKIPYSAVELALLELLAGLKTTADFSLADKFFESAVNLRPSLLNLLLHQCKQVKAKRLFLWFSDRHNHDWLSVLETSNLDIGSGKRMIVKGGTLNSKYQITVPKEMTGESGTTLY